MRPILLLACSGSKNETLNILPASERYQGSLFRTGMTVAEQKGFSVLILSAKFGFISPETKIPYYNERFKTTYNGEWPEGEGFYLGGVDYFKNAPERFKPLVAPAGIGDMTRAAQKLLNEFGLRSGRGVVAEIYKALRAEKQTKEELKTMLREKFPEGHPKMEATVDIQLRQYRIGDERDCWLKRDGDYYWLELKNA